MNLLWLLFGFNGRINRAQFWLGTAGAGVGGVMLFVLLGVMFAPMKSDNPAQAVSSLFYTVMPVWLLLSWIGFALHVKRLHDRGRSGAWTMLPVLPLMMILSSLFTAVAAFVAAAQSGSVANVEAVALAAFASAGVWILILILVQLFMFVDLGCMPGKPEANKYGNPPGGGLGGDAPVGASKSGTTMPGQPSRANTQPASSTASTLVSAESAIERAIAAQQREAAAPSASRVPRPAMAAAQPGNGLRPATPGTFGRRASR